MYTHILFDLDGTLTDSREGVVNCVKYALEKMGRPILPERELNKFLGPPLQQMFQELCGFTPEEAEEGIRLFRERYNTIGKFENAAAPGAVELLRTLKERGYMLALASSKPEAMCHIICDHYGLSPWLDVIAGSPPGLDAEKAEVIRSALERLGIAESDCRRVLMVGDRKYDVLGAAAFGMDCAGAEFFGYAEPGELETAGAVTVVNTTEELLAFILNH
jgi:phosphoglycolate phosphatase